VTGVHTARQLVLPGRGAASEKTQILARADAWRAISGRGTHVVQLGPVAVAHVHEEVVNDAGEVGADSAVLRANLTMRLHL